LSETECNRGDRTLFTPGSGVNRPAASETDPANSLVWNSEPLGSDLDVVGDIELQLEAVSTAPDTAWIAGITGCFPGRHYL